MTSEALEILRHWRDELPLDVADSLARLSDLTLSSGDGEGAKALAREAWSLLRDSDAGGSWAAASARVRIARCFTRQGLFAEAETLLLAAHEILTAQLGESHRDTREASSQLVALYTAWGRPRQAAAFVREAGTPSRDP